METLIYFDEFKYESNKSYYESLVWPLQSIVNKYLLIAGLAKPDESDTECKVSQDDFLRIFTDTKLLIFEKLSGEETNFKFGGLTLSKEKALSLIEMPEGFSELESEIEAFQIYLKQNHEPMGNRVLTFEALVKHFQFNADAEIIISANTETLLSRSAKVFATSERANKMLELANSIKDKIAELGVANEILLHPQGLGRALQTVLRIDKNEGIALNVRGLNMYNGTQPVHI